MICDCTTQQLFELVNHQIQNLWIHRGGVNYNNISSLKRALERLENNFKHRNNRIYECQGEAKFSVTHSVQYSIFLYTYANQLYLDGNEESATLVYYLNKVMHSVEWFYAVDFPSVFSAEHPLCSVVGRAKLSDYLFLYQGTTIGGNRRGSTIYYPQLGHHIVMCSDSKILGDSHIGNNVILSANSYVINENIPDNCIVFGQSPNLTVKLMEEKVIVDRINEMCSWKT